MEKLIKEEIKEGTINPLLNNRKSEKLPSKNTF